jgi:hypothetical protein
MVSSSAGSRSCIYWAHQQPVDGDGIMIILLLPHEHLGAQTEGTTAHHVRNRTTAAVKRHSLKGDKVRHNSILWP